MIEEQNKSTEEIAQQIHNIIEENKKSHEEMNLEKKNLNEAVHLINNSQLPEIFDHINKPEYLKYFDYQNLSDIESRLRDLYERISDLKEDVDISKFMKNGKVFDFQKLKKEAKAKGVKKQFKNFDIRKLEKLMNNPILEIYNYKNQLIKYDPFVVKKLNTAIIQMIFNEMDLYMINYGEEGSGKSCWSSQVLLYMYTVLKSVGLIQYAYDVKNLFFSSIETLIEAQENQSNDDFFKIMTLDEAYDLNRQNFREETSMIFKDDMRSARKLRRINQLNLPQIGELDTSITLSRTNFIFHCRMDNQPTTGTLRKGEIDMFVIPRGNYIYSPMQKRNIPKSEIKTTLAKRLEKKSDYYLEMPRELLIKKFSFKDVWGFDPEEYAKHIKTENKKKRFGRSEIKTSEYIAYILYKKMPDLRKFGTFDLNDSRDMRLYKSLWSWLNNIKKRFEQDSDKLKKFEALYQEGAYDKHRK